tara:strand:- start:352 stop:585 length:234 start_codon:yes stop_codon:yes gene_type:complete
MKLKTTWANIKEDTHRPYPYVKVLCPYCGKYTKHSWGGVSNAVLLNGVGVTSRICHVCGEDIIILVTKAELKRYGIK